MEDRVENDLLQQIDILVMLRDVVRQWWMILLFAISAALITNTVIEAMYTPEYTATTTFTVASQRLGSNTYQDLSATTTLAKQFSYILDSNVLKKKIAEDLEVKEIDADISVEQVEETNLLTISVTADSAEMAYRVIKSIMENYDSVSNYAIENIVLQTIQEASIPTGPSNSIDKSMVRKAFLIAAAIAIALVLLGSYIRDTVKTEKEFTDKIDAKLLGSIPHETKKGHRFNKKKRKQETMLIQNPMRSFRYVESNRMVASKLRSYLDRIDGKVVLFTSVMENEGKSTVAANMALALAQEGKKVALIDCDFRKPAQYKIFGAPKAAATKLMTTLEEDSGKADMDQLLRRWKDTSLYTIFNSSSSPNMEALLGNDTFCAILDYCRKNMDYVVLDTSPMALVSETEELSRMCDASVLVVKQDVVLSKDINDAIDALNNMNGKVIGCIFNDVLNNVLSSSYNYKSSYIGSYGGHNGKRV